MVDDILTRVDGGLSIRQKDGRYQKVETPVGFTDTAFRNGVIAFDSAYRLKGAIPTLDEVHVFWPKITKKVYAELFLTDEFKQALSYRGVEWDFDSGLSEEQSMALLKMTDWSDHRTPGAKLKELHIPVSRWDAWMNNPLFKASYTQRVERQFANAESIALQAVVQGAASGKIDAAKFLLEITGRWNPSQMQVEDARTVVTKVLEAVIKHTDPKTRELILSEVRLVAGTMGTVPEQRSLEG